MSTVGPVTANGWLRLLEENPGHSDWYIERFRAMAAAGADLDGEARLVDAMAARGHASSTPAADQGESAHASPRSVIVWSAWTSIRR